MERKTKLAALILGSVLTLTGCGKNKELEHLELEYYPKLERFIQIMDSDRDGLEMEEVVRGRRLLGYRSPSVGIEQLRKKDGTYDATSLNPVFDINKYCSYNLDLLKAANKSLNKAMDSVKQESKKNEAKI